MIIKRVSIERKEYKNRRMTTSNIGEMRETE
jgi:hypothetical protein